jgi:hypothetical protein
VDTFTAERYSPHWMNWADTPARRPAARPANKTRPPPPTDTHMATATPPRYRYRFLQWVCMHILYVFGVSATDCLVLEG